VRNWGVSQKTRIADFRDTPSGARALHAFRAWPMSRVNLETL
jgi:hypothetical protein